MKTVKTLKLSILLAIVTIFSSCEESLIGIRGNGSIVSNEVILNDINGVSLEISGNIHLTQGDTQSIIIDAQQNIFDNLDITIHNGVAEFDFDRKVKKHDGMDIYITLNKLTDVILDGSGDINTTNTFNLDEPIKVNINGSGDIKFQGNVPEVNSSITGSGNIRLGVNTEYLEADISGSGDYFISGTTIDTRLNISGSGNISAFDFISDNTTVNTSGSGNSKVFASKHLDIDISGSGDVSYKGHPIISSNISGNGNIKNAN